MGKLQEYADRLPTRSPDCGLRSARALLVDVELGQRQQTVRIEQRDSDCLMTSVVLQTNIVTKTAKRWRDLAIFVWQLNPTVQLVTFSFDKRDRLIGLVRHPLEYLDYAEFELYVKTLAYECDRLEYLLSGRDVN